MDVIETIYKKSIQPSERSMRSDREYKRAKNQVKQYYHMLSEKLSENDKRIVDKLISCSLKETERKNIHCFKCGFKTGLAVAVKSLE